jgi:D-alanyl-D-alanine carboxypeptidase
MLMSAVAAALLALLGAAPAFAGLAKPTASRSLNRALDRIVAMRGGPPGISVLIRRGARDQFRSRGVARVGARRRPGQTDRMRIASIAKAFNGAVVLALVARGQMSLDDTVGQRLPGVLPRANDVTLGQMLHHTGGLPDYIRQKAFIDAFVAHPKAYMSPQRIVGFVRDVPLDFPPGSKYHYSDTDNIVAALMAEAATGLTYEQLLRRYVYLPLRLRQTTLPRTARMPRPFLHGYEIAPPKRPEDVSQAINPAGAWASGGIVSTPVELGRMIRGYVGGSLFGPRTARLQRQWIPGSSSPPGPGVNSAGLGVFRYRTRCGTVYGHTGSFPGYRLFAAATGDFRRSVVFAVSAQIVPGQGSLAVSNAIRRAQEQAVCVALRGPSAHV